MSDWATVILAIVQLMLVAMVVGAYLQARTLDPFAPFWSILLCQAITFGIRPIMLAYDQPRFGAFYPYVDFDPAGFHFASWCGLISTVMLVLGYELVRRRNLAPLPLVESAPALLTLTLCTVGIALGGLALAANLGRSQLSLNASDLLLGRARGDIGKQQAGHGYETFAWAVIPMYVAAVSAAWFTKKPRGVAIPILFASCGVVFLLPVGARATVILTLVTVAFIWNYHVRRIPVGAAMALGLLFFVIASAMLSAREGAEGRNAFDAAAGTTISFDGFEALVALSRRLSLEDLFWGRTYFESFFYSYIPRAIWVAKPVMWGTLLCEEYIYPDLASWKGNIGTFPPGYVAEAMLNFWYLGLVCAPLFLGAALAFVERLIKANPGLTFPTVIAAIMVGDSIGVMRCLADSSLEVVSLSLVYAVVRGLHFAPARPRVYRNELAIHPGNAVDELFPQATPATATRTASSSRDWLTGRLSTRRP